MMVPMARREDSPEEAAVGQRIARNIQALLRARGWTQGQLAYKASMNQSAISQLAMGRRRPSIQTIYQVSRAFGIPMEELAGFKPLQIPEPAAPDTPQDQQLADRMTKLERELLALAKGQKVILERMAAEGQPQSQQSPPRKRAEPGSRGRKAS